MDASYSRHVQDKEIPHSQCQEKGHHYFTSGLTPIADEGVDFPCFINCCLLLVRSSHEWRNPSYGARRFNMVISSLDANVLYKAEKKR